MVGCALRPCNRWEELNRNCTFGYLVVGWAFRPCNKWENLNINFWWVVYLVVGWLYACLFYERN